MAASDPPPSVETLCVLAGDVHGFGGFMRSGADAPVRQALEAAVRKWSTEATAAESHAGDTVWIAHDDPVALAQIARHIMDEVYRVPGQPRLRIALHHGDVQIQRRAGDGSRVIAGGEAVLCAARVERLVEPGQIWASEDFQRQLVQKPSLWRTVPLAGPDGADLFNVKKEGGTAPDLWVRLFRLEF